MRNGVEDEDEYEDDYEPQDELNQYPATRNQYRATLLSET
jgi:hypothetical protein